MIKKYVIGLLEQYAHMKKELSVLEYEMENLDLSSHEDMIEAMTHNGGSDERVSTGGISDPTPSIALAYEAKYVKLRDEAICRTRTRIFELSKIVSRLEYQVGQLEADHAAIIREHYFEKYSWTELASLMNISKTTLLKQKDTAISNLCEMYALLNRMGLIDISENVTGR